jgi:RNase P/RNase MRP subunit p29
MLPLEKDAMQTRRKFLLTLAAAFVGMGFVVATVLADEILGVITKVDYETKKVTVIEKDKDDEIVLETNADTEYVTKDGSVKVDKEVYEKFEKSIEKAKEAGKKGFFAKITYDKKLISKIQKTGKGKKAAN